MAQEVAEGAAELAELRVGGGGEVRELFLSGGARVLLRGERGSAWRRKRLALLRQCERCSQSRPNNRHDAQCGLMDARPAGDVLLCARELAVSRDGVWRFEQGRLLPADQEPTTPLAAIYTSRHVHTEVALLLIMYHMLLGRPALVLFAGALPLPLLFAVTVEPGKGARLLLPSCLGWDKKLGCVLQLPLRLSGAFAGGKLGWQLSATPQLPLQQLVTRVRTAASSRHVQAAVQCAAKADWKPVASSWHAKARVHTDS
eukprot:jgi/Chlat1/3304/Chrsp22S03467